MRLTPAPRWVSISLCVLDGEILVHIDGNAYRVGPRGVAIAPRGVPHAFLVTSPTARVLTLQTPGSAEAFYRAASEPATRATDPAGPVDFARVREAAECSGGMQLLGPPFAALDAMASTATASRCCSGGNAGVSCVTG